MTRRNWMQGHNGEAIDHDDPSRTPIKLDTIAHALAMIPRFGGHTRFPYSVALHSVHVSCLLAEEYGNRGAIVGLLHDAHEAYVGDVTTPIKRFLGCGWAELERAWETRIAEEFGIELWDDEDLLKACKHADLIALSTEREQLLRPYTDKYNAYAWPSLPAPDATWPCIEMTHTEAKKLFLRRAKWLGLK